MTLTTTRMVKAAEKGSQVAPEEERRKAENATLAGRIRRFFRKIITVVV